MRKVPASKRMILGACEKVAGSKKVRSAQMRQLEKLKGKLIKNKPNKIKKEEDH
jgi:hypothetical protein